MDGPYIGKDNYFMSKPGRRNTPLNKNMYLKQSKWLVMNKRNFNKMTAVEVIDSEERQVKKQE